MTNNHTSPETIQIPEWYRPGGGMMYRREYLSPNHPGSVYNYIKNELGLNPEEYGYFSSSVSEMFHSIDVITNEIKSKNQSEECKNLIDTLNKEYLSIIKSWLKTHTGEYE